MLYRKFFYPPLQPSGYSNWFLSHFRVEMIYRGRGKCSVLLAKSCFKYTGWDFKRDYCTDYSAIKKDIFEIIPKGTLKFLPRIEKTVIPSVTCSYLQANAMLGFKRRFQRPPITISKNGTLHRSDRETRGNKLEGAVVEPRTGAI